MHISLNIPASPGDGTLVTFKIFLKVEQKVQKKR